VIGYAMRRTVEKGKQSILSFDQKAENAYIGIGMHHQ